MPNTAESRPSGGGGNSFLKSWAWKREHRPDRYRFELPYEHKLVINGKDRTLTIKQRPFKTTGLGQCHSISKILERWPSLVAGKRCLELGAGCGLAGIVSACLGAEEVVLTDLPENLPLLKDNSITNSVSNIVSVEALVWGSDPSRLNPPYDVIIATDIMYIIEALSPLLNSLKALSGEKTTIFLAYGRNRQAEDMFMSKSSAYFEIEQVAESSLDSLYQCIDVDVYQLRLKPS